MLLIRFYRLLCMRTNRRYIGKTHLILEGSTESRLYGHETNYKSWNLGKKWVRRCGSFDVLFGSEYAIELINSFEFDTDDDNDIIIRIHEQIYIDAEREDFGDLCCNIRNAYTSIEDAEIKKKVSHDKYNAKLKLKRQEARDLNLQTK